MATSCVPDFLDGLLDVVQGKPRLERQAETVVLHATLCGLSQCPGQRCIGSRATERPPFHLSAPTHQNDRRTGFEPAELVPDLLDLFGRPARPALTSILGDQDSLDRLTERVIKATSPPFPAGLSLRLRRLDVREATLPVDVVDQPGPSAQEQDPRAVLLAQEGQLVDETQLLPAMKYGEERRREEDGEQFEEVLSTVSLLALLPEAQDPLIAPENLVVQHPLEDLLTPLTSHFSEGRDGAKPLPELAPADPLLLERQRHQLLGEDVIRQGRWNDRFDVSFGP